MSSLHQPSRNYTSTLIQTEAILFCSGVGQYHSENNLRDPRPYLAISETEIEVMVQEPPAIDKTNAQWAIFSTELSRAHQVQFEHEQFIAFVGGVIS